MKKGKKEGKEKGEKVLKKEEGKRIGVEPPNLKLNPPLRVFLFSYFKKSLEEKGDFPPKEEVLKEVAKRYPNSIAKEKWDIHFSYYKSLYRSLERLGAIVRGERV